MRTCNMMNAEAWGYLDLILYYIEASYIFDRFTHIESEQKL